MAQVMVDPADLDIELDMPAQQTGMNIYTQLTFCYRMSDGTTPDEIVATMRRGLEKLSEAFPWVAGRITVEQATEECSGIKKIKSHQPTPILVSKDIRNDESVPTMAEMEAADFPMTMIHEDVFAPCKTIPEGVHRGPAAGEPVILLQITFIREGCFITFGGHHSAMDMVGQAEVIRLLSVACQPDHHEFTASELSIGNCERKNLIPLLKGDSEPELALQDQLLDIDGGRERYTFVESVAETAADMQEHGDATEMPSATESQPSSASWVYVDFSASSLGSLKSLASQSVTKAGDYISTDDAITAFLWQSITRVRTNIVDIHSDADTQVRLARAVNARRYLHLDPATPGLIQNMVYHQIPIRDLLGNLDQTALALRKAVDPATSDVGHRTRALATYLSRTPDKSGISYTARLNPSKDVALSSWSSVDAYALDFGFGLGKPVAVRRPAFVPVQGLVYLMPKAPDGSVAVALCLSDNELEKLKRHETLMNFVRWIG